MDKEIKIVQLYFCKKHTLITKVNVLLKNSQIINVFVVMEITQVGGWLF
jgi:hypothetical protein